MLKPIFVISLKKSTERRNYISKLFKDQNIEFTFFDAFDGANYIQNSEEQKYQMSNGELGCLFSHRNIYQKMISEQIEESIILEDDIQFGEEFKDFFLKWKTNSPANSFEILKIGYSDGEYFLYDQSIHINLFTQRVFCGVKIARPRERTFGSFAYLITLDGAKRMLDIMNSKLAPIDVLLHESPLNHLNLFVIKNQLVTPNFDFNSIIRDNHTFLSFDHKIKSRQNIKHRISQLKWSFIDFINLNFVRHLEE